MARPAFVHIPVTKVNISSSFDTEDVLAAEEPVEIRLEYGPAGKRTQKSISVTMRTPGNDMELATGFLYTEGIITSAKEIASIKHCNDTNENVVRVSLDENVQPDMAKLDRHFYTTSSCGVCGKSSIEAVRTACNVVMTEDSLRIPSSVIYELPDKLRKQQEVFKHTGGLHGCALFDVEGNLLLAREDVGRHNAVDKLIGAMLDKDMLPLQEHILLLSGRASFELVQKATMAGIKIIVAIGAPSSLAAQMCEEWGMTLIGFLRGERYNIYTGAHRIIMQ
ncbi:MAG: formate dehydrogenase accessory sulfurtransferase FdhD [Flavipsychrobacter sp.]|nr:formate dehydrogenase accessory sulfurtransferase FdhD [Flavipsychrobacter sp.]